MYASKIFEQGSRWGPGYSNLAQLHPKSRPQKDGIQTLIARAAPANPSSQHRAAARLHVEGAQESKVTLLRKLRHVSDLPPLQKSAYRFRRMRDSIEAPALQAQPHYLSPGALPTFSQSKSSRHRSAVNHGWRASRNTTALEQGGRASSLSRPWPFGRRLPRKGTRTRRHGTWPMFHIHPTSP